MQWDVKKHVLSPHAWQFEIVFSMFRLLVSGMLWYFVACH